MFHGSLVLRGRPSTCCRNWTDLRGLDPGRRYRGILLQPQLERPAGPNLSEGLRSLRRTLRRLLLNISQGKSALAFSLSVGAPLHFRLDIQAGMWTYVVPAMDGCLISSSKMTMIWRRNMLSAFFTCFRASGKVLSFGGVNLLNGARS